MTRLLRMAALAIGFCIAATAIPAGAQTLPSYHLYLTVEPTGLKIDTDLATSGGYPDDTFVPSGVPGSPTQVWYFGPVDGGYDEFGTGDGNPFDPSYYGFAWKQGGGPNYDILLISPSGNRGNENFTAYRGVPAADFGNIFNDGDNLDRACLIYAVAYISCPVLANGQTFTQPINIYGTPLGSLTVSFTDGAPEPAAWLLLTAGVFSLGGALRRRSAAVIA